jgi:NDP-sugar pyrophosphorylase family protein
MDILPTLVIFMTARRAPDIPKLDNPLACLLPLGSATFAERVIQSCALAGVKHIHVVVSDCPEAARALLGDGSAWGLSLTWHLAKDGSAPYTVLRSLSLADAERVVVGHADHWISEHGVRSLLQRSSVAMHIGHALSWCGWYSDCVENIRNINPFEDYADMSKRVCDLKCPWVFVREGEFARPVDAATLLRAQSICFDNVVIDAAPASWRRMAWGAMSPDAVISPNAIMVGPVLVGPGCVVSGAAQIGPHVILHNNVFVSNGAEIANSVILSNTYVDGRVTLDQTVVQGNSVQNLKWNVSTVLDQQDAMLAPLFDSPSNRTPLRSRIVALLLLCVFFPLFTFLAILQCVRSQPIMWRTTDAIRGRHFESCELERTTVREPSAEDGVAAAIGLYGAMLDVAQGRRRWFGLRIRNPSEWYSLGRDWQNLFSQSMVGVFHAPSWAKDNATCDESHAAADAFMAVHPNLVDRLRLIRRLIGSLSLKRIFLEKRA